MSFTDYAVGVQLFCETDFASFDAEKYTNKFFKKKKNYEENFRQRCDGRL